MSDTDLDEKGLDAAVTSLARELGCDRGTFSVCWDEHEGRGECRCKAAARAAIRAYTAKGVGPVAWMIRTDERPVLGIVKTKDEADRYVQNVIAYARGPHTNIAAVPLVVAPQDNRT